jgi:hypothetical protein
MLWQCDSIAQHSLGRTVAGTHRRTPPRVVILPPPTKIRLPAGLHGGVTMALTRDCRCASSPASTAADHSIHLPRGCPHLHQRRERERCGHGKTERKKVETYLAEAESGLGEPRVPLQGVACTTVPTSSVRSTTNRTTAHPAAQRGRHCMTSLGTAAGPCWASPLGPSWKVPLFESGRGFGREGEEEMDRE